MKYTQEHLLKLKVGDSLLDTHYGILNQLDEELEEAMHCTPVGVAVATKLVSEARASVGGSPYLNKMLTVVDIDESRGIYTLAYTNDGEFGGIVTFVI